MTTQTDFPTRNRDMQDGAELHVWGELSYVDKAGAIVKVNGTGTIDEEVPVLNSGYSFNLEKDTDAEVLLISLGSDTNKKFALPTLPRDRQRQWKAKTGGVQNPLDGSKALEFNPKRSHMREDNVALGNKGTFEVDEASGDVIIRGNLIVQGDLKIGGSIQAGGSLDVKGSIRTNGSVNGSSIRGPEGGSPQPANVDITVPGFEDYDG